MLYFQTKNLNLGKFWRALESKMLVYFMVIWNILLPLVISSGHLVMLCHFVMLWPFWYIVSRKIWQPRFANPFFQIDSFDPVGTNIQASGKPIKFKDEVYVGQIFRLFFFFLPGLAVVGGTFLTLPLGANLTPRGEVVPRGEFLSPRG
jgi:hypothetical protein